MPSLTYISLVLTILGLGMVCNYAEDTCSVMQWKLWYSSQMYNIMHW